MLSVGAILFVAAAIALCVFVIVGCEIGRRGLVSDEPSDEPVGDYPNLNSFVFHAPETDA